MLEQGLLLLLSLVVLFIGAEVTLTSAEKVGKKMKLSPLVIGLLIVGFGTSLPEFFVSQLACYRGHPGLALGNILGSNVANTYLILGMVTLFQPLSFKAKDMKHQLLLHLAITALLSVTLNFKTFSLFSSFLLMGFFVYYLWDTLAVMKGNYKSIQDAHPENISPFVFLKLIFGFVLLYGGGELLVSAGPKLGELLGVPNYVISAVFVAFGTSFPELMTAAVAAMKKKDLDLVTGNIIGSNIFNIAFVLASLGPYKIPLNMSFGVELSALVAMAIILIALNNRQYRLKWQGGLLFLSIYAGIVVYWAKFQS